MIIGVLLYITGWTLILTGLGAIFSGVIGLFRFPDFYTKLHAAGVIDSFGTPLCLIGLACLQSSSSSSFKLILAAIFIFLLSPAATNALASASLRMPPNEKEKNDV